MEKGKISGGETFLGGKCLKKGHRKFGVPGNVILQKKPVCITDTVGGPIRRQER